MSVEQDLKTLLKTTVNIPRTKDVSPHHIGMSEVVSNLEKNDLATQSFKYRVLMDQEAQELISQLRHRASMLRIRADELDGIADGYEKFSHDLAGKVNTFLQTYEETHAALQTMAHINPTKITNEGG